MNKINKKRFKKSFKRNLYLFIMLSCIIIGTASVLFATIYQSILCYQRFGIIISENLFMPHWSAWFYLGGIPLVIGGTMVKI